jgi:hypothetical protein
MPLSSPLRLPLRLGLTALAARRGVGVWSPARLFSGGIDGAFYDPSQVSSLFQDLAGTVPVTASGQAINQMRDLSGNANHAAPPVATSEPLYILSGGLHAADADGTNDRFVCAGGGGSTTAFYLCLSFELDTLVPAAQILWDDSNAGNGGFRVIVRSTGRLDVETRNGTTNTAVFSAAGAVVASTKYVLSVWYDGTNTRFQINKDSPATSAAVTPTAGISAPAIFCASPGISTSPNPVNGRIFAITWTRNHLPSVDDRDLTINYVGERAGLFF